MTGIIGALTDEVEALVKRTALTTTEILGGLTFYEGDLEGQHVVIVQSGVGKVNAAFAAALLYARFKPDTLINTGVAGGIVPRGSTVISTKLVQHDVKSDADGTPQGQVSGFDSPYFEADQVLGAALLAAAEACGAKVCTGVVASGDQFICDGHAVRALKNRFDVKAVDMESAAIAQVCELTGMRFCALRTVTDNADEQAVADFYELVKAAAATSCAILTRYLRDLSDSIISVRT